MKRATFRKNSLYLPGPMVDEIKAEAERLGRPMSWIVQKCVEKALVKLKAYPSPDDVVLVPSPEKIERETKS